MRRITGMVVSLGLLVIGGATGRADVAPPRWYVERCTLEREQKAGETCEVCSTYHAKRDACETKLEPKGYAQRCRTRGASVWREVWCKSGGEPVKKGSARTPAKTASTSCSTAGTAGENAALVGVGILALSAAAVGALLLRRRRRAVRT